MQTKMKVKLVVTTLLIVCGLQRFTCRIYSKCELAKQLIDKFGVPRNETNHWVCIGQHESDLNTSAINRVNVDGTWDYGIFQLNSGFWCQGQNTTSNGCNLNCTDLLSDNIDKAVSCAKNVIQVQGFSAWVVWNNICQGDISNYTYECNI